MGVLSRLIIEWMRRRCTTCLIALAAAAASGPKYWGRQNHIYVVFVLPADIILISQSGAIEWLLTRQTNRFSGL